jgi:hypothetical protein
LAPAGYRQESIELRKRGVFVGKIAAPFGGVLVTLIDLVIPKRVSVIQELTLIIPLFRQRIIRQ